jgi:hypothetical protein
MVFSVVAPIGGNPAQAAPIGYPHAEYINYARVGSNVEYPGGAERAQVIAASFDGDLSAHASGNHLYGAVHNAGGSGILTLKWAFDQDVSCWASQGNPTEVLVEIRSWGGNQVGSQDWIHQLNGACTGTATKTVNFDADPLDGDNSDGPLNPGPYEIYIRAQGDSGGGAGGANLSNADSRGAAGNGPHLGMEFYSSGRITISQGLVFNEPFTGANDSVWSTTRWSTSSNGATKKVDVQNNQGRLYTNTASARATASMAPTPDSEIAFKYRFDNVNGKSYLRVYLRSSSSGDDAYRVELRPDSTTVKLQKVVDGTSSTLDSFTYSENTTDTTLEQFRFRIEQGVLSVKIWPAGSSEPSTWQIEEPDTSVAAPGVAEIHHNWSSSSSAAQAAYLDNLSVYDILLLDSVRAFGSGCPEVIGSQNPEDKTYIEFMLKDVEGCDVPIRHGDEIFGAEHIRLRNSEVGNHPLDAAARGRMEAAMTRPLSNMDADEDGTYRVYAWEFHDSAGNPRTQCVWRDEKKYFTYNRKGIITSFVKVGHLEPHECHSGD